MAFYRKETRRLLELLAEADDIYAQITQEVERLGLECPGDPLEAIGNAIDEIRTEAKGFADGTATESGRLD